LEGQIEKDEIARVVNTDTVRFRYCHGGLKEIWGKNPGVSLRVTSVVEFGKKLLRKGQDWRTKGPTLAVTAWVPG